jgi:DNA-binding response OmpR family regulator
MAGFESHDAGFSQDDEWRLWREAIERRRRKQHQATPRAGYLVELSGEPISLDYVEFRLLDFLSAHPYKAFSRRQIAEAISSPEFPVTEATLDGHVMTLRDKLGLFSDYVQTVPYIGYRFKE